jgi:hypothetical protein
VPLAIPVGTASWDRPCRHSLGRPAAQLLHRKRTFPGSCGDRNTPSPEVLSVRFSYCMVPEVYQLFWAGMARGEFITDAAVAAGTYRKQGTRWLVAAGGVRPRRGWSAPRFPDGWICVISCCGLLV